MHFFSPVHKMPLLEVIRHPGTSQEALATVVEAGRRMGKTVIVVGDGPGFFTSRVLTPFLNEAAWLLVDGASIEQIDRAMTRWGWPVGPFTLLDEVGLDVGRHAGEVMHSALGERLEPPAAFQRMIDDGRLGRKAKRGFYLYEEESGKGKKGARGATREVDPAVYRLLDWKPAEIPDEEIVERCWLQMLNETARCMEEGIIADPADVDIGVIFGFGFPPFRGGLLREADRKGLAWVVERLERYAALRGPRLEPASLLRDMARQGKSFYQG
jgi:3-hydroxyacyl-CoA dehydrogenase/enoyl-CoA hydratase/3-hydroxybutyryl-CoA epimerase